jgi:hypothetical protein
MSTTTNPDSLLWQLRRLVPKRPLNTAEAYRIAELQANRLLAWGGIDEPGTPGELVSGLPYVHVVLHPAHPESGYLKWFKPRWLVLLNPHEARVRQRFSLMHEFKHLLDHPFRNFLYPSTYFCDGDVRREKMADYFAACVLMPKRLVKRCWGERVQSLAALAAEFDVSQDAMHRRLQELGLIERPPRCGYRMPAASPSNPTEYFRRRPAVLAEAA